MATLERLLAPVLWPWLRWRSRAELVHATLADLPFETAAAPTLPKARIAVVQLNIELAAGAQAFVERVYAALRQAVRADASLVILPEYTSLPLLGLLPGVQRLAGSLATAEQAAPATEEPAGNTYDIMGLAFRLAAPAARRAYLATMAALAARFRVTLLAGSLIELGSDRRPRNVAYLFGPDGSLLARQMKTHLVPSEVGMGYAVGTEILVTETAAGRISFPVCMDHTYFETARIAELAGADLLIDPAANNAYYSPYAQARGVWNRVQEVHAYGVLCCGVGRVAGTVFEGRSGVYAPLALSPTGDGVLAEAATCDRQEVILADLDYDALRSFRRRNPREHNLDLYRRYLPAVY